MGIARCFVFSNQNAQSKKMLAQEKKEEILQIEGQL